MCTIIVINRGEKELSTVNDFKSHFNTEVGPPQNAYDVINGDCCLCQIDVEKELKKLNVPFCYDFCNYYIGEFDETPDVMIWRPITSLTP